MKVQIFVFIVDPGIERTLLTTLAPTRTGQRILSSVEYMWTVWFLQSFFWNSKVMMIISDEARASSELVVRDKNFLPFLNWKFLRCKIFVLLLSSAYRVDKNSQDRMQKKKSRMRR